MTELSMRETYTGIFFEDEVKKEAKIKKYIPDGTDVIMLIGMDINLNNMIAYCKKNEINHFVTELGPHDGDTWEKAVYEVIQDCTNIVVVRENRDSTFMDEFIETAQRWSDRKRTCFVEYIHGNSPNAAS